MVTEGWEHKFVDLEAQIFDTIPDPVTQFEEATISLAPITDELIVKSGGGGSTNLGTSKHK